MKTLLFYCQHILGMGQLVRSMAIAQGLTSDFKVYLVNGGETIQDLPMPEGIELINLPAIKTDPKRRKLQVPKGFADIDAALAYRRDRLLELCDRIHPSVVMVERFPFGRRRFSAELIPLLERAKAMGAKTCCSLRNIVMTQQKQHRHEITVCKLMNRYFDQLLIHADPKFIPLEQSFSRVTDLDCEVHYTGYVVPDTGHQFEPPHNTARAQGSSHHSLSDADTSPTIVVSIGSGRRGHELLDAVAQASQLLEDKLPHRIQIFTGPSAPLSVYRRLMAIAQQQPNLEVQRESPDLLQLMAQADLSISLAGYNTTLNVLKTGVRTMLLPRTDHGDQQYLRSHRLKSLGVAQVIHPDDLTPKDMAFKIISALHHRPNRHYFHLRGVEITAARLNTLVEPSVPLCA